VNNLLREVHARSLWQVLGLYLAVSWVVLQVVDVLADNVALPDWVFPISLVLLLLGLPVVLGTAFVQGGVRRGQAGAKSGDSPVVGPDDQRGPSESGDASRDDTSSSVGRRSRLLTWRNALLGGAGAFALLTLGIGGWLGLRAAGIGAAGTLVAKGMLADRAQVVISDFSSSGADPALARTLTEAFRIDFTESPTVEVVDPSRVTETLRRMERDPEAPLDLELARELAQREGFPAVIAGEIGVAGSNYLLTGQVVAAADGAVLVSHRETASEDDLLDAIDALSQRLRERIGEPLSSLAGGAPLERVTTSSFAALDKYSEAERLMSTGGSRTRAISLLSEAIELDSTFAMAHRKLGISLYIMREQRARQVEAFTRAFELRDRLTDHERYITEGTYYTYATGELDRAVTAYENAIAIDPLGPALNNLGIVYQQLGDHERALEMFKRDIAGDPNTGNPYVNALFALSSLGRPEEMRALFDDMYARFPTPNSDGWGAYAYLSIGDYETADLHIGALTAETGSPALQSDARAAGAFAAGVRGQLLEAERLLGERVSIEMERGLPAGAWESEIQRARFVAGLRRDPQAAVSHLEAIARTVPVNELSAYDRPYAQLAIAYAEAGRTGQARTYLEAFESEVWPLAAGDPDVARVRQEARGSVALAGGDVETALDEFRRLDERACPECRSFALGRAFDQAGSTDSARVYYEHAITVPSGSHGWTDAHLLGRSVERLAQLHDEAGDLSEAARFYARFTELWADADEEFQDDVRAAQARLEEILREIG
jgi:tetratricopeptide (TPR) repeat protein